MLSSQAAPAPLPAAPAWQALTATVQPPAPAAEQARPAAEAIIRQGVDDAAPRALRSIDIQLKPVELGRVNARLTLRGGQLAVELRVETAEAHRRLSSDSETIVRSLKAVGYEVDRVTVLQLPAAGSQSSGERGAGQAPSFDRGGERTGEGGGNGTSGRRGDGEERSNGRNESGDRNPPGGVYI